MNLKIISINQIYATSIEGSMGARAAKHFKDKHTVPKIVYFANPMNAIRSMSQPDTAVVIAVSNTVTGHAPVPLKVSVPVVSQYGDQWIELDSVTIPVTPMALFVQSSCPDADFRSLLARCPQLNVKSHVDVIRLYSEVLTQKLGCNPAQLVGHENGTTQHAVNLAGAAPETEDVVIAPADFSHPNLTKILSLDGDLHVDSSTLFKLVTGFHRK